MANRPVFRAGDQRQAVYREGVEFQWFPGMSDAQKRRCITSLHEAYLQQHPRERVLEISSKSEEELGVALSAFHLTKYVPSLGRSIPVENVFQGGKIFSQGGPFTDLYGVQPIEAKRDARLRSSGPVKGFFFEGKEYPSVPYTAFYCWIWCNALLEHVELARAVLHYDAFTDIVFNPEKSRNCQAEAAAIFVGLVRQGRTKDIRDFDAFLSHL